MLLSYDGNAVGKLVFILATPYVFAGMAISVALTRSP